MILDWPANQREQQNLMLSCHFDHPSTLHGPLAHAVHPAITGTMEEIGFDNSDDSLELAGAFG